MRAGPIVVRNRAASAWLRRACEVDKSALPSSSGSAFTDAGIDTETHVEPSAVRPWKFHSSSRFDRCTGSMNHAVRKSQPSPPSKRTRVGKSRNPALASGQPSRAFSVS